MVYKMLFFMRKYKFFCARPQVTVLFVVDVKIRQLQGLHSSYQYQQYKVQFLRKGYDI